MIKKKIPLAAIVLFTSFFSCEHSKELKKSEFKVARDYSKFATKMENYDTLNIEVNLSNCMWFELDKLQITKTNDSIFIHLQEKIVMDEEPIHLKKVYYEIKNDTLSFEKMMTDLSMSTSEKKGSAFFTITNPKEKDTIVLSTSGLEEILFNIERYRKIMFELYPKEMEKCSPKKLIP